jgi:hypothetical protein
MRKNDVYWWSDAALAERKPVPLFAGKPWFMPAVFGSLTLQDKLARRRGSLAK